MYTLYRIHPIEREFEAWAAREIEDYFASLGVTVDVYANSREFECPADEFVDIGDKIIGLQFKRPYISKSKDCLYWKIKSAQLARVKKTKNVFYALPNFLNRKLSRESLHHTLIWRPDFSHEGERAILDGQTLKKPRVSPSSAGASEFEAFVLGHCTRANLKRNDVPIHYLLRWGRFAESIMDCFSGELVTKSTDVVGLVKSTRSAMLSERERSCSVIIVIRLGGSKVVDPAPRIRIPAGKHKKSKPKRL